MPFDLKIEEKVISKMTKQSGVFILLTTEKKQAHNPHPIIYKTNQASIDFSPVLASKTTINKIYTHNLNNTNSEF